MGLFTNLRIIAAIVAVSAFLLSAGGAYVSGRSAGYKVCSAELSVQYKEGVKRNAKIEKETNRMPEPDLDRALRNWVQP